MRWRPPKGGIMNRWDIALFVALAVVWVGAPLLGFAVTS